MMENMFDDLNLKDKIILHLNSIDDLDISMEKHIEEIGNFLDYKQKKLEVALKELRKEDLIIEGKGDEKKRDITLTEKGKEKHESIWNNIKDRKFLYSDNEDSIELNLQEIANIHNNKSILSILNNISKEGIVDLNKKSEEMTDLIGRDTELEKIKKSVEDLKNSNGSTQFIIGSTGIGKTRLANEVKNLSHSKGFDFIKGMCNVEEYKPYKPFREALDKFIKCGREIDTDSNMIVDSSKKGVSIDNKEMFDALKKSTFFETTQYLKKLSSNRPLVIFLDDLQWADKGSLNLLDYMTDRLQDDPVLFICTYRPGDVTKKHPLKETTRRMSRKKTFNKIKLNPLKKDDISDLIEKITDMCDIPESFVDYMQEKTNGNPLFIKESIKQMLEENMIDAEKCEFPDSSDIILIPDLIENVIERRIVHFNDDTRKILQLGSVIGKKVPFDLLVEASDMDELELLDHIDTLIDSNIWFEESQDDSFSFSHDLIVDTIYKGTGRWLERKLLHKKIGNAIELLYENKLENKYSTLAYHFKKGENFSKSFDYYIKSAEEAEKVYAQEDAIEKYKESLKVSSNTEEIDDKDLFYSMEKLADAYSITGKYEDSRENFKQALSKASNQEEKKRIYRKIAQTWVDQGEYERAESIIKKGLNIEEERVESKPKKENSPETCRLLSKKGWVKRRKGEYEKAHEIFKKELEMAEELNDKKPLSQAYHDLGTSAKSNKNYQDGIKYLKKAVEIKEELDDKKGLSRSLNNLGVTYYQIGNYDESLEYFEESYDIDKEIGRKIGLGRSLHNIGLLYQNKGELEKSEKYYNESLKIKSKIGDRQGLSRVENSLGLLEKEKGRFDKAIKHLNNCMEISENIDDYFSLSMSLNNAAEIYIEKGDLDKGKELTERSYEIAKDINNKIRKSHCLNNFGMISRLKGDTKESVEQHKKGIDIAKNSDYKIGLIENRLSLAETYIVKNDLKKSKEQLKLLDDESTDTPGVKTRKKMLKGILFRENDELEKSEKLLKEAIDKSKDLSKKYRIARLYFEIGVLYKKKKDQSKSKRYLKKSIDMTEDMGMQWYEKKARSVLNEVE